MEKIIYHGRNIAEAIARKEKRIVELYSRKRKISYAYARQIYLHSTLMDAIRDVENELWTQSEYYILEAYESYLDKVKTKMTEGKKGSEKGIKKVVIKRITKRGGRIEPETIEIGVGDIIAEKTIDDIFVDEEKTRAIMRRQTSKTKVNTSTPRPASNTKVDTSILRSASGTKVRK